MKTWLDCLILSRLIIIKTNIRKSKRIERGVDNERESESDMGRKKERERVGD